MLKLLLSKFEKIALGVIVLSVIVLIIWWKKTPSDNSASEKLTTEQRLLDQTADLMKQLIQEKDKRIESLEQRNAYYEDLLKRNSANRTTIIKQGNEKVNSVNRFTDDDILRYLSNLDSADISAPIIDSK